MAPLRIEQVQQKFHLVPAIPPPLLLLSPFFFFFSFLFWGNKLVTTGWEDCLCCLWLMWPWAHDVIYMLQYLLLSADSKICLQGQCRHTWEKIFLFSMSQKWDIVNLAYGNLSLYDTRLYSMMTGFLEIKVLFVCLFGVLWFGCSEQKAGVNLNRWLQGSYSLQKSWANGYWLHTVRTSNKFIVPLGDDWSLKGSVAL